MLIAPDMGCQGSRASSRGLAAHDRAWVIDESAAALSRGQVDHARLAAYVDELASVRAFAVITSATQRSHRDDHDQVSRKTRKRLRPRTFSATDHE